MANTNPSYVFVNKTTAAITISHEYHPLPCIPASENLQPIVESSYQVARGQEQVIGGGNVLEDERYERVIVVTRTLIELAHEVVHLVPSLPQTVLKGLKKLVPPPLRKGGEAVDDITHTSWRVKSAEISLVGLPTDERLFIYPVSFPPYTLVTQESLFFFKLLHAVVTGSQEALGVLLEEAILHPFLLEALKVLVPPNPLDIIPNLVGNIKDFFDFKSKPSISYRIRRGASDGLCPQEAAARTKRLAEVRKNVTLPDEATKQPVIATVTSGGGMRAMIASVGFFAALKEMGILDIVTYASALSGSTWSVSKWMNAPHNPFVTYKNESSGVDCWSVDVAPQDVTQVDISGLVKTGGEKVTPPDAFKIGVEAIRNGSLLMGYSQLLEIKMGTKDPNYTNLVGSKTDTGKFPIPVYTACYKDNSSTLQWADFTPYEIGSTYLNTYFGPNDFQLYAAPSPPLLSHLMAVWGSAFYCTFAQLLEQIAGPANKLPDWMYKVLGTSSPLSGAQVVNANYNKVDPVTGKLLPMANQRYIYYRDGGILANLPIPPVLRPERGVNLLIVLDSSATVKDQPFGELVKAIPSIASKIPTNPTYPYTFEAGADHPQIIYIPVLKNDDFNADFDPLVSCGTFTFEYDESTVNNLQGLAYYWTKLAKGAISQCISQITNN